MRPHEVDELVQESGQVPASGVRVLDNVLQLADPEELQGGQE